MPIHSKNDQDNKSSSKNRPPSMQQDTQKSTQPQSGSHSNADRDMPERDAEGRFTDENDIKSRSQSTSGHSKSGSGDHPRDAEGRFKDDDSSSKRSR